VELTGSLEDLISTTLIHPDTGTPGPLARP
jgi:hypothetical protein